MLYTYDKSISNIMNFLSHDFTILSKWFYNNFMVLNPDKCSFMLLGVDDELQTNLVCGNETLKNSKQKKVLGVTINNKLYFAAHLSNITKNANIKFNELTRVQKHMTIDPKKKKEEKRIFSSLLNRISFIALLFFAQNILLVESAAYMKDPCTLCNKTTPLISKYFVRMQMKNQSNSL